MSGHRHFKQLPVLLELHEKCMISIFSYMEIVWLAFLHKPKILFFLDFNISKKLLNFLNYQTLIKAYKNMSYKTKRNFKRFWKKLWRKKGKRSNISISRTTLYTKLNFASKFFVFKKRLFEYENHLAVEKKTQKSFWGAISKILLSSPSKKYYSYLFHIWKLYD